MPCEASQMLIHEKIKKRLLSAGWNQHQVEEGLKKIIDQKQK